MSRTLSASIVSHLAERSHTRCLMLLLALNDGTVLGVTDHDQDLAYDLTVAGAGTVTYQAGTGILASDVSLSASLDADNYEVTGPIGEVVTLEAVLGGRYNRARAWLFQVNWADLTAGVIPVMRGNVTEVRPEGGKFILEIRSDFDRYNQVLGETLTNQCKADFGDARCTVVPEAITGTGFTIYDALHFVVTFSGSYADGYFSWGKLTPLTGANAGCEPIEIFKWFATGELLLFTPLASTPVVGDSFTIERGCSKLRKSDDPLIPTCLSYSNVINFRGFPEIPGSDKVLRATIPGRANQ